MSSTRTKDTKDEKKAISVLPAMAYYLLLPFIYALSILPFPLLYGFSDFVYVVVYKVAGYRKKVVLQNLRNSFPSKSEKELQVICSAFYHFLCDFILEMIKEATISKEQLMKRCKLSPDAAAVFDSFAKENKSVLMVMGHNGNWEWACNAFNIVSRHQLYVIYHPLTNKYFNDFMTRLRTRNGTKLIAMRNTYREMVTNKAGLNATVFVADQTPLPGNAYWTTFLNQETPVFKGMEVIAKKMNLPVIYTSLVKTKRGYYSMNAEVLCANPVATGEGELSEMFTRRLEQDIIAQPETWLWSHRRWKHKRPATADV